MTLEAWSTAASIGTLIVVATTAIAALIQLRHMRSGNQIAVLTEVRVTLESERFTDARRFLHSELPALLASPQGRRQLSAAPPMPHDLEPIRTLANFFENVGAFVRNGIIDQRVACDLWATIVLDTWRSLEPVVLIRRTLLRNPALWENFEYLAVLCQKYQQANPSGSYPPRMQRMEYAKSSLAAAAVVEAETRSSNKGNAVQSSPR